MSQPLFCESVILHVTNFDVNPPDGQFEHIEIGYLCGGFVSVFSDGSIVTVDDSGKDTEKLNISDLLWLKTNINSYDQFHSLEISFVTDSKEIEIQFRTQEAKEKCQEILAALLENSEKE